MAGPVPWYRDPPALVPAAALALALVVGLGRSFWLDEILTATRATEPVADVLGIFDEGDAPNAAHYLLVNVLPLGDSEIGLRLPSLIAAAATVVVAVRLAQRLFDGQTAWLTGAVLALHGMMQHYGQEARSYALATLAATVAAWCAVDAVDRGAPRRWCWFGAAVAVGVYLHLSVLLVAIGVIGGLLATTPERRWVRPALLALGGAAVVTIPVTDYLVADRREAVAWIQPLNLTRWARNVAELSTGGPYPRLVPVLALVWIAAAVWIGRSDRGRARDDRMGLGVAIGWAVIPVAVITVVSVAVQPAFVSRYMVVTVPAMALLSARAVTALPGRLAMAAAAVTIVVIGIGLVGWRGASVRDDRQNWRGAVASVAARVGPGDIVLLSPPHTDDAFDHYAARHDFSGVDRLVAGDRLPPEVDEVFVVTSFGAPSPLGDTPPGGLRLLDTDVFDGRVVVRRYG